MSAPSCHSLHQQLPSGMVTMAQTASIVVAGASIAALVSQPALRGNLMAMLAKWTGYNAPGGVWRIAAILLALANLKNLPFVWHVRTERNTWDRNIKLTDIATLHSCLLLSALSPTDPDPSACALPTDHNLDPHYAPRNRLQHAQVQQHLLQRHGHITYTSLHCTYPQRYQEEQSSLWRQEECSSRSSRCN